MFRKIRILYNNNKITVWAVIGIIIFIYVILRLVNANIRKNNQQELNNSANMANVANTQSSYQSSMPSTDTAVMTDTTISKETLKTDTDIIKQFIDYCNNNNIEEAYNLLSDDCKKELYNSQEKFEDDYVKEIFTEKRSYDIQAWEQGRKGSTTTYKVKYLNDIMSTGVANDEYIEEYITIVKQNDEKKLNVNQFIGTDEINKKETEGDLQITVNDRYKYYDYVEYEITFENNGENDITIDTKDKTDSVYVKNSDGVTYDWFGNEVPNDYLTLHAGERRSFRIKFNEMYSPKKGDTAIYFTDVHLTQDDKRTIKVNV